MVFSCTFVLSKRRKAPVLDNTVGWWNFWQTCPLVSGVKITGQTKHRAVLAAMLVRPGSTTELCVSANCFVEVRSLPLQRSSLMWMITCLRIVRRLFLCPVMKFLAATLCFSLTVRQLGDPISPPTTQFSPVKDYCLRIARRLLFKFRYINLFYFHSK